MGYDLHITRKEFWADPEVEKSISIEEWKAYVIEDPEITLDSENPGVENYLFKRVSGESWPLWYCQDLGEIFTKNPEPDVIQKMVKIANHLGAKVRRDDDELYDLNGSIVGSQTSETSTTSAAKKRPWWLFW